MVQLVYCILAILILSILTMTSQRGIAGNLEGQTLAEVETQATGVATEVLEFIDQTYFDLLAYDERGKKPYCGRISGARKGMMSTYNSGTNTWTYVSPGTTTTVSAKCSSYATCNSIEGFHGLATPTSPLVFTRGDLTYNVVDITVTYVNPDDYDAALTEPKTYAKKVSVTVENPYLYFGTDPSNTFKITFERVFEYGCATDLNLVPYITATGTCPINRTPPELPCARW